MKDVADLFALLVIVAGVFAVTVDDSRYQAVELDAAGQWKEIQYGLTKQECEAIAERHWNVHCEKE